MLKRVPLYSFLVIALVFGIGVFMRTQQDPVPNEALVVESESPRALTTDTWGVFDPETGSVLVGNNIESVLPIASVTKLFTADAVLDSTKKFEPFIITASDVATEGRAGKLVYGEEVTPYELLFPLLIESSNDAAEAIRRKLGNEFTYTIDGVTDTLELPHTKITDASGLSPENVSTVEELSLFYADLKKRHPHILDITQLNTYVGPVTGYVNNDPARSLNTFTGGKHGYTDEAKRTFVGTFILPDTHTEIGVVVLKSEDLLTDIETILAYHTDEELYSK